jgi:uncharacterized damage-inducible protein DinB
MITTAERTFAIKQLDQSRTRLLRVLEGLSPEQLLYRPGPGRWSIAENVEHVIVVEKRVQGAIEKLLQEPPDLAKQCCMSDAEIVWQISTVREPVQAPERALPTSRWPAESLLQEFETTRRQTRDFTQTADGDFRKHFLVHPLFGDFDCYQWLLAIGAHCNRHCTQSEAVKQSALNIQHSAKATSH